MLTRQHSSLSAPICLFLKVSPSKEKIPIRSIGAGGNEVNIGESFRIRSVQELLSGKDMVHGLHRHNFFFVLTLEKGAGRHEIDFVPCKVGNHTVFLLRPGQVHQLTLKAESTGYLMEFNAEFYPPNHGLSRQLLRAVSHRNHCPLNALPFEKLIAVLDNIFHEYTHKGEKYQEVIKANLEIFLIELIRNRQHRKNSLMPVNPYSQERVEEFLELLETQLADHRQVSYYARELNLSPYQLNAITKAALGKTVSALINDHIILEAKRYLLATSNQVNQIAYQLGYEDVSYFIRLFKKHTGLSPEAFRRTNSHGGLIGVHTH